MTSIGDLSNSTNPATSTLGDKKASKDKDNGAAQLASNMTDFLKLLTTQLQHQDPTAPTDTNQFTQQLIGFSQVEQTLNTNTKLDKLVDAQTSSTVSAQLASGVNYIGKMAEVPGNTFQVNEGEEPKFSYTLPEGARQSVIKIYDAKGALVGSFQGAGKAGTQNIVWDAKNSSGARVAPGAYTVKVDAINDAGKPLDVATSIVGEVTGVELKDGVAELRINDSLLVALKDVKSVVSKSTIANAA